MKNQLLNLKMIALMCLMMVLGGAKAYAISSTLGPDWNGLFGTSYSGVTNPLPASLSGINSDGVSIDVKTKTNGYVKTGDFRAYKDYTITIKAPSNSTITAIKSEAESAVGKQKPSISADNGTVQVSATSEGSGKNIKYKSTISWTGSSNTVVFSIKSGSISFGKITVTYEQGATLKSLAISGTPKKTTYNVGEEFDPTGLLVTGTYEDNTTATITNGITWTKNPETMSLGNTSCTVTASVGEVKSEPFVVNGLKVVRTISLSIDPTTSTVVKAPVNVTLTAPKGATVYYTTNGDEPTTSSTKYTTPFDVTVSGTTVKALAVAEGAENVTAEATYTIKPDQPVFSDESKTFKDAFDVTLSLPETTDATSKIHYAIGAKATAESPVYEKPINISAENDGDKVILHAVVVDKYGNVGKEKFCTYTKTNTIVFDFTSDWEGITATATSNNSTDVGQVVSGKELNVEGVVMTATNKTSEYQGTPKTYYTGLYTASGSQNLRVYGSVTFTAPKGYNLLEVTFAGSKTELFTTEVGAYKTSTWTGNAHAVTFTASKTVQITTATIKLVAAEPVQPTSVTINLKAKDNDLYYATFSSDKDVIFTNDVTVYGVSVEGGKVKTTQFPIDYYEVTDATVGKGTGIVENGHYVPAKTGVLVEALANSTSYYFPKKTQSVECPSNMLMPAPANGGEFTAENDYKYYKLAYDDYEAQTGLGFYWGAENGGAFKVKAGTAYLAVHADENAAKGFTLNGEATGIEGVNANVENAKAIYNLNGQRVASMAKPGLYIVNGKKVVRK